MNRKHEKVDYNEVRSASHTTLQCSWSDNVNTVIWFKFPLAAVQYV